MIRKHEQPRFRCGVLGVVKGTRQIAPGDRIAVETPIIQPAAASSALGITEDEVFNWER
jgi:hypothetical protein